MNSGIKIFICVCISIVLLSGTDKNAAFAQEMGSNNSLPVYPGGNPALKKFITENLHYPEEAVKAGISGTVLMTYLINKQGKIQDIKVIRGISPECDAEAVRVTGMISDWSPAIRMGKPADIIVKMGVEFKSGKKLPPVLITGKVTDKVKNIPIEGVLVIIKSTTIGTVTNADGFFGLQVPGENQYLEFIAQGYTSVVESIDKHSTINVDMNPEYFVIEF